MIQLYCALGVFNVYLRQLFFLVRLHPKAIGCASRNVGCMVDFSDPADLTHHPTLLMLLLLLLVMMMALTPLSFS